MFFMLQEYENRNDLTSDEFEAAKITILNRPKHGKLEGPDFIKRYTYSPKRGYFGKDSVTALVEIRGVKVKIQYFIHALEYNEPDKYDRCEQKGGIWKISLNPEDPASAPSSLDLASDLTSFFSSPINAGLNFSGLPLPQSVEPLAPSSR